MDVETKMVLSKARGLISEPECWIQGQSARNSRGIAVDVADKDAVAFCAYGAIYRARLDLGIEKSYAVRTLRDYLPRGWQNANGLMNFNDTGTHAEVLALFDSAIQSA